MQDHLRRTLDRIGAQREPVANVVMKKMTSWGALLIGATLLAGIYGMNFEHMPELGWQLDDAWAVGLMATLTVAA